MKVNEIKGNLITLALQGEFDVIAHGCNCFCTMGAGIAPQMADAFGVDVFHLEDEDFKGDYNKLGQIDYGFMALDGGKDLAIVNAYTQYGFGRNHKEGTAAPIDYVALQMVMRKINHIFKGKHIGLPHIGAGLAGGNWEVIKTVIIRELKDCSVTLVEYDGSK